MGLCSEARIVPCAVQCTYSKYSTGNIVLQVFLRLSAVWTAVDAVAPAAPTLAPFVGGPSYEVAGYSVDGCFAAAVAVAAAAVAAAAGRYSKT